MRTQLRNGAVAGLIGGAALALVLLLAGEGPLQRAVDLEHSGGDELVSRAGQRVGGVVAALLVGTALGLVFATVEAAAGRRVAPGVRWRASLGLAGLAFVCLHLVPFLKYPPNPPGVGDTADVGRRTALYVVLLAWSVLAAWSGWRARPWLGARGHAAPVATAGAVVVAVALLAVAFAVLPSGPDPDAVPASVVWSFRLASVAGWSAYWTVVGMIMAWTQLPEALRRRTHATAHTPA